MPPDGIQFAVHLQSIPTHLADNRKKDWSMARPPGRVAVPHIVKTIRIPKADQFGPEARDCRLQFGAFNCDALRAPINHVRTRGSSCCLQHCCISSAGQGWYLKTLPPFITNAIWRSA